MELLTILPYLLASLLAVLAVRRLTALPLRIGFTVVETSASARTIQAINLPSVPSIAIARGEVKAIGIEIMKVFAEVSQVDPEAGQNNNVTAQLVKGASPGSLLEPNDQRSILRIRNTIRDVTVTSVGEIFIQTMQGRFYDLTDGDGRGELVLDNEIFAQVAGSGNANTKTFAGYLLYHLVDVDGPEATFELLEQSQ